MREIKFRGWDVGFKEMESWESLLTSDVLPEVLQGLFPNLKLMQHTGLEDKNGVEIYEGDIVISQDGTGGLVYKHIVEWNEFYKRFEPMGKDEAHFNRESCEVVGNIYENPELLKDGI